MTRADGGDERGHMSSRGGYCYDGSEAAGQSGVGVEREKNDPVTEH